MRQGNIREEIQEHGGVINHAGYNKYAQEEIGIYTDSLSDDLITILYEHGFRHSRYCNGVTTLTKA